ERLTVQPTGGSPLRGEILHDLCSGYTPARTHGRFHRCGLLHARERAIARLEQEPRFDQGAEQCIAGSSIESPQAARLRRGQPQSRHLEKLTLHAPEDFVGSPARLGRHAPSSLLDWLPRVARVRTNRYATHIFCDSAEIAPDSATACDRRVRRSPSDVAPVTAGVGNPIRTLRRGQLHPNLHSLGRMNQPHGLNLTTHRAPVSVWD